MTYKTTSIQALYHDDPQVREAGARALYKSPSPQAIQPLIDMLLHDCESSVRYRAAYALCRYCDVHVAAAFITALAHDVDADVRYRAAYGLGLQHHPQAVHALVQALGDPKWHVRHSAALALGKLGDTAALDALQRCQQTDSSRRVCRSAAQAIRCLLGKITEHKG